MEADEVADTVHFKCSETVITCQICMEIFESPRILPCQHTFCKDCVVSLLKRHCLDENGNTKKASFPCPNCRRDCKIRRKGKRNIEEHLECFPENLLLKTVLSSKLENSSDKYRPESSDETETQNENVSDGEQGDQEYGVMISRRVPGVIEERLWFYCLFLFKLQEFLTSVQVYYSGSLSKVRRSVIELFLNRLLEIPRLQNDPMLYQHHASEYFDFHDIDTTLRVSDLLEERIRSSTEHLRQSEAHSTWHGYRSVQTQTVNCDKFTVMFTYVKNQLHRFLLATLTRNTFSSVCILDYFIFENLTSVKKLDYSLFCTTLSRKLRCWLFVFKMYDIVVVMYTAGLSIYWPLSLWTISYVLLLVFFKRIKIYIDGGGFIGAGLPFFSVLLTSLNLYSNASRTFVYCSAVIHLQYWLVIKLILLELVPEVVSGLFCYVLLFLGKEHYISRYGPVVTFDRPFGQFPYE